jgi:cell wall-associated NlpC family hydrolase
MAEVLRAAYLRNMAVEYIWKFVGVPYRWGGDDPMAGFDCSGLVVEVLQAVGRLGHGRDYTAHDLWTIFKPFQVETGYAGCLVFWFDEKGRAKHVEMMIDNEFVIGASGGGSMTQTVEDAIKQNAFVKMRPLRYRGINFKIVDPFKEIG